MRRTVKYKLKLIIYFFVLHDHDFYLIQLKPRKLPKKVSCFMAYESNKALLTRVPKKKIIFEFY